MEILNKVIEDVRFMYAFYGWYIIVAIIVFILVYGFISYLAASNTTTQSFNMGIPVPDYDGSYWATYLANVIISIPLTIIVIWLLLHLIKVLFRFDVIDMIKQLLSDKPIVKWIDKVEYGLETAEHATANFFVNIKNNIETVVKPLKKDDNEGFSTFEPSTNVLSMDAPPMACNSKEQKYASF